ncbi:hypothetical protein D9758_005526 [Tetrapyrgos nigripes]|uniref:Uncharacterized protein n=1 Tax=Tetrapyrgos nigripes TaxID=182062 RepID=A0A8H5GGX8_9AGAR|nr:hypothetical protein D9758_005526 [Tetrapyrgos nigripes]
MVNNDWSHGITITITYNKGTDGSYSVERRIPQRLWDDLEYLAIPKPPMDRVDFIYTDCVQFNWNVYSQTFLDLMTKKIGSDWHGGITRNQLESKGICKIELHTPNGHQSIVANPYTLPCPLSSIQTPNIQQPNTPTPRPTVAQPPQANASQSAPSTSRSQPVNSQNIPQFQSRHSTANRRQPPSSPVVQSTISASSLPNRPGAANNPSSTPSTTTHIRSQSQSGNYTAGGVVQRHGIMQLPVGLEQRRISSTTTENGVVNRHRPGLIAESNGSPTPSQAGVVNNPTAAPFTSQSGIRTAQFLSCPSTPGNAIQKQSSSAPVTQSKASSTPNQFVVGNRPVLKSSTSQSPLPQFQSGPSSGSGIVAPNQAVVTSRPALKPSNAQTTSASSQSQSHPSSPVAGAPVPSSSAVIQPTASSSSSPNQSRVVNSLSTSTASPTANQAAYRSKPFTASPPQTPHAVRAGRIGSELPSFTKRSPTTSLTSPNAVVPRPGLVNGCPNAIMSPANSIGRPQVPSRPSHPVQPSQPASPSAGVKRKPEESRNEVANKRLRLSPSKCTIPAHTPTPNLPTLSTSGIQLRLQNPPSNSTIPIPNPPSTSAYTAANDGSPTFSAPSIAYVAAGTFVNATPAISHSTSPLTPTITTSTPTHVVTNLTHPNTPAITNATSTILTTNTTSSTSNSTPSTSTATTVSAIANALSPSPNPFSPAIHAHTTLASVNTVPTKSSSESYVMIPQSSWEQIKASFQSLNSQLRTERQARTELSTKLKESEETSQTRQKALEEKEQQLKQHHSALVVMRQKLKVLDDWRKATEEQCKQAQDALQKAQDEKVVELETKKVLEELQKSEDSRQTAEEGRKQAEDALQKAEQERDVVREGLQQSESLRKVAEEGRENAENMLRESEQKREVAEVALKQFEAMRQTVYKGARDAIRKAGDLRKAADEERKKAEDARQVSDEGRRRAENAFHKSEEAGEILGRNAQGQLRKSEGLRKVAEEERKRAEDAVRVSEQGWKLADERRKAIEIALRESEEARKQSEEDYKRIEHALRESKEARSLAEAERKQAVEELQDLQREVKEPFVVPALLEAFGLVSYLTSQVVEQSKEEGEI